MKRVRSFFLCIVAVLGLATASAQDAPFDPYAPAFASIGAGIRLCEDVVRISAGVRIDNRMESYVYLRSGYRLASSRWCRIYVEPFWMNYSINMGGYNTPIGIDFNIVESRWISAGARLDLYGKTKELLSGFVYEPSVYFIGQIATK